MTPTVHQIREIERRVAANYAAGSLEKQGVHYAFNEVVEDMLKQPDKWLFSLDKNSDKKIGSFLKTFSQIDCDVADACSMLGCIERMACDRVSCPSKHQRIQNGDSRRSSNERLHRIQITENVLTSIGYNAIFSKGSSRVRFLQQFLSVYSNEKSSFRNKKYGRIYTMNLILGCLAIWHIERDDTTIISTCDQPSYFNMAQQSHWEVLREQIDKITKSMLRQDSGVSIDEKENNLGHPTSNTPSFVPLIPELIEIIELNKNIAPFREELEAHSHREKCATIPIKIKEDIVKMANGVADRLSDTLGDETSRRKRRFAKERILSIYKKLANMTASELKYLLHDEESPLSFACFLDYVNGLFRLWYQSVVVHELKPGDQNSNSTNTKTNRRSIGLSCAESIERLLKKKFRDVSEKVELLSPLINPFLQEGASELLCTKESNGNEQGLEMDESASYHYRALLGELMYFAGTSHPDLLHGLACLAKFGSNPSLERCFFLEKIALYLHVTKKWELRMKWADVFRSWKDK